MKAFFLKIRKATGWFLILISTLLMAVGFLILIPAIGDKFGITRSVAVAGGLYAASIPPWYLGLSLLGPEIIAKTKEIYNVIKRKIWRKQ
ncbi:MAG: hypothetical protein CL768_00120 [Chloroflexi bacterium]|nr:hypothetical protein [Chloroflexota bacterium]|tara:strand:+ start:19598 stop:19867 length:270 start_codon:yes stop_codon:yes gene_type:complete